MAAAVDELLPRLQGDPQLGVYWKGQNTHTKQRGRQLLLDFLVQALGGPAIYQGLNMKAAHEGLNITESDWAVMERHAVAVLDKFGIQGRERELPSSACRIAGPSNLPAIPVKGGGDTDSAFCSD